MKTGLQVLRPWIWLLLISFGIHTAGRDGCLDTSCGSRTDHSDGICATHGRAYSLLIPHIAASEFWTTRLVIDNLGDTSCPVDLTLYGDEETTREIQIAAQSQVMVPMSDAECGLIACDNGDLRVRLTFVNSVGGIAEFALNDASSRQPCFLLPPNHGDLVDWMGLACMNPGSAPVQVAFCAVDRSGRILSQTTTTIAPKSRLVTLAENLFADVAFHQLARIHAKSDGPLAGITISGLGGQLLLFSRAAHDVNFPELPVANPEFVEQAQLARVWLMAHANHDGHGWNWDEMIGEPAWDGAVARPADLYSGVAGIGLFLLKLAQTTGSDVDRRAAIGCGTWLADQAIRSPEGASWNNEVEMWDGSVEAFQTSGLYSGNSGIAFALLTLGQTLDRPDWVAIAQEGAQWIQNHAIEDDAGCYWGTAMTTDIISGSAGILLFLLEMYRVTDNRSYLETARDAGDWLLAQIIHDGDTCYWPCDVGWDRIYTGFSHGVAGVAYALAHLSEASGDSIYLDAAEKGARWLVDNATCDGQGCRWFHYTPEGTTTFQTGWCHGPAGTARLFMTLHRITGRQNYWDVVDKGAKWIMNEIDPESDSPGFWGMSFCCGAASVGEFFADLYAYSKSPEYKTYAQKVAGYIMNQAHSAQSGRTWTNYPYPDDTGRIWYSTGLKSGAAGIGWFFLRMATLESSDGLCLIDEKP